MFVYSIKLFTAVKLDAHLVNATLSPASWRSVSLRVSGRGVYPEAGIPCCDLLV